MKRGDEELLASTEPGGRQTSSGSTPSGGEPPYGTTAREPDGSGPRFHVTTCVAGELSHAYFSAPDVHALDPGDVDFSWDKVFGRISIRLPDGQLKQYFGGIPGLGVGVGMPLLEDVLWALGELLTERQLKGTIRTGWETSNARDQRVAGLRRGFGDSAEFQHFFIVKSRPWRIAWNTKRSWRIIER